MDEKKSIDTALILLDRKIFNLLLLFPIFICMLHIGSTAVWQRDYLSLHKKAIKEKKE